MSSTIHREARKASEFSSSHYRYMNTRMCLSFVEHFLIQLAETKVLLTYNRAASALVMGGL